MAIQSGADVLVKTDDMINAAIKDAKVRAEAVPATMSLVEMLVQKGVKEWDDYDSNIVVSSEGESHLFDDDDCEPQAA